MVGQWNSMGLRLLCCWGVVLLLMAQAGCMYRPQTITGEVVDKTGKGIAGVAVTACYVGSEWLDGPVWGSSFCSEPVITDHWGGYSILFKGPEVMSLYAKKEGWTSSSANSNDPTIVLITWEERAARDARQRDAVEQQFRTRLMAESDAEYYCRVVMKRVGKVTLNYAAGKIEVVQALQHSLDSRGARFAVMASDNLLVRLSNDFVLTLNGEPVGGKLSVQSAPGSCPAGLSFIGMDVVARGSNLSGQLDALIPSIRAGFEMSVWDARQVIETR